MTGKRIAGGRLRNFALLCASFAVFFAFLTFIGWISGLQLLASVRMSWATASGPRSSPG